MFDSSIISVILSSASTQTPPPVPTGFGNLGGMAFLLVIVGWVVVRRIMYAVRGRRFSRGRVLSLPIIYVFLTVVIIVPLEYAYPIALLSLLTIPVGFVIGYLFGRQVSFFNRGGVLFFKRSPVVMIIWLVSYIARVVLYYAYGASFEIAFVVDAALALTAGMLIGESIRILRGHSEYTRSPSETKDEFDMMKEM